MVLKHGARIASKSIHRYKSCISGEGPSEHEEFGSSEDDEMLGDEDLEDDL